MTIRMKLFQLKLQIVDGLQISIVTIRHNCERICEGETLGIEM